MERNENGELILNECDVFRKSIKQALIDSKVKLFGFFEDSEGNLYMNCNGNKFVRF